MVMSVSQSCHSPMASLTAPSASKNSWSPAFSDSCKTYVLQLSEKAGDQEFFDALGAVKDAIGEWHDWETLITIAAQVLGHDESCKLIKQLELISKAKYERALSITNHFRSRYVKPEKHGARRFSFPAPVLRATSAIAA